MNNFAPRFPTIAGGQFRAVLTGQILMGDAAQNSCAPGKQANLQISTCNRLQPLASALSIATQNSLSENGFDRHTFRRS